MSSPCTETVTVRLTPYERLLIEGVADTLGVTASDLARELMSLEREDDICRAPRLRLVSVNVAHCRR